MTSAVLRKKLTAITLKTSVTLALGHVMTSPTIAISARMTVQSYPKIGTGTDDYARRELEFNDYPRLV